MQYSYNKLVRKLSELYNAVNNERLEIQSVYIIYLYMYRIEWLPQIPYKLTKIVAVNIGILSIEEIDDATSQFTSLYSNTIIDMESVEYAIEYACSKFPFSFSQISGNVKTWIKNNLSDLEYDMESEFCIIKSA